MATDEVLAHDPADWIIAFKLGETRFYLGDLAGQVAVATIEDLAFPEDDGIAEAVGGDVGGEVLKIDLGKLRKDCAGRVETVFGARHLAFLTSAGNHPAGNSATATSAD